MESQEQKELARELALLCEALRLRARRKVRQHLLSTRQPQSCHDIAQATALPVITVCRALIDLLVSQRVKNVGVDAGGALLFRPVEIGRCEWCGVVSHYLVAGECPDHRAPVH